MNSTIFNSKIIKNSPVFAKHLKQLIKTDQDETYFLDQLAKLEKQRLANEIAEKRKEKHWSQSQLADKIGTTQAVVSRMEQGKVNFGLNLLVKLRATLGVSMP